MTVYSSSLIRRQIAIKIALILTLIGYITVSISISKFHMFRDAHQNKVHYMIVPILIDKVLIAIIPSKGLGKMLSIWW